MSYGGRPRKIGQEHGWCQNRNAPERIHGEKVTVSCDQAGCFAEQSSFQQSVVIRIAAAERGTGNGHPLRYADHLPEKTEPAFGRHIVIELRSQQSATQLIERLVREQQDAAVRLYGVKHTPGRASAA